MLLFMEARKNNIQLKAEHKSKSLKNAYTGSHELPFWLWLSTFSHIWRGSLFQNTLHQEANHKTPCFSRNIDLSISLYNMIIRLMVLWLLLWQQKRPKRTTGVVETIEWATDDVILLDFLGSIFWTLSLVIGRLSPVDGWRVVAISPCFAALVLLTVRLSEVEGRHGTVTVACFCARSLVTGRLSAEEGRRGVETSAGFLTLVLVIGCRSPTQGIRAEAEEGLLTPVTSRASFVVGLRVRATPPVFWGVKFALRTLSVLVFWFIVILGFTEADLWNGSCKMSYELANTFMLPGV
jgi:hypothetical protein